jgi:integrase
MARKPGSVFQRKDGKWVASLRHYDEHAGKSVQRRRYASTRDGARRLLAEMRDEPVRPSPAGASTTAAAWVLRWAETSLPASDRAPGTVRLYSTMSRTVVAPNLGQVRLSRLTPSEVEAWQQRVRHHRRRDGQPIAVSSARIAHNALTAALDGAVREGLIRENPARKVSRPTAGGIRPQVPHTTPEQVDRLIAAAEGRRVHGLLVFVSLTGCRLGEALSLRWSDVDLDRGTATIRRGSLDRESTKTGNVRTVPLLPEVVEALRAERVWQNERRLLLGSGWGDGEGLVFTSSVGTPIRQATARRSLVALLEAEGLPTERPWHSLRHGLATRLLARGTPMPLVSALLGHASITTTVGFYGHVEPALEADVLARAMGR